MNRKVWLTVAVLGAICAWMMVMPLGASAVDHSNADCALCHGAESIVGGAYMDVGSVNKATACRKCHLDSLVGTHPTHYGGGNCGAICHTDFGPSLASAVPMHLGTYGAFSGPDSENLTAGTLHTIHSTPRWMADKSFSVGECGSCHATAACTACHNSTDPAIDDTHVNHGNYGNVPTSTVISPWVGNVSVGVASSLTEDTMLRNQAVKCGSPTCHDIASIDDDAPLSMDTYIPNSLPAGFVPANVVQSGTWRPISGSRYQLGRMTYSNTVNSTFTFTFTGERVELLASRDPYYGIAAISVDGSAETTISLYNATTVVQRKVWRSDDLGAGQHTVRIRVTGDKEAISRSNWVSVDGIKIHGNANDSISPTCGSCHAMELPDDHGGDHPQSMTFSHDVTQTIAPTRIETDFAAWDGAGGYACTDCHTANLRTDHRRSYASGMVYIDGCAVCHPTTQNQDPTRSLETSYSTYRRSAVATVWTDTYVLTDACNYSGCHHGATIQPLAERTKHGQFVSKHTTNTAGESPACSACHPGDLRQVHNNPIPGNGKVEDDGCLSCHAANRLDQDKTCSRCHLGGYASVTATGHAIKDSASHNASEAGKAFSSAYQGGRADQTDGGFECVACHTSQLVANHATPGTMTSVGCSTGGAGAKGCHMDTTLNSINVAGSGWTSRKCSDCHSGTRSHDNTVTPHLVGSNGCAGSATGCHESNDLWELHAVAYDGGAPDYQNCANAGCHDSARVNKRPTLISFADSCGSTSPNAGCHTSLAVDHATNFQHTFSAVSQYNGGTETGCTNQSGCHNAGGTSTSDYGDEFHPASGCFSPTGKCHASASKAAFTGILPTDCQECHNGAFTGAQSRNNLTQPLASGGHYSDTTHTATGMGVAINSGGTGSATCANCHAGSLMSQHATMTIAGSPYGGATSCGECHADTRANGNAQVVANWTNNTCADCHTAGSTSPLSHAVTSGVVAEVGSTCGSTGAGCHNSTDLHALHKNNSCDIAYCHNYALQSQRPSVKGCGGTYACHNGYTNASHGPITGNEATHTATGMTAVLDASYNAGGANTCQDCHTAGITTAHKDTSTTAALKSGGTAWSSTAQSTCFDCHNATTPDDSVTTIKTDSWSAKTCDQCHVTRGNGKHQYYVTGHVGIETGYTCSAGGCHNTTDLRDLHNNPLTGNASTAGCDSAGCHDGKDKPMRSLPASAKTCGQGNGGCHTDMTNDNHGSATAHGFTVASDYNSAAETGCNNSGAGCHGANATNNYATAAIHGNLATTCTDSICHDTGGETYASSKTAHTGDNTEECVQCHTTGATNWNGITARSKLTSSPGNGGHYSETTHTAVGMTATINAGGAAGATCNQCHNPAIGTAWGNGLMNQHDSITPTATSTYGTTVGCGECHNDTTSFGQSEEAANWTNNTCADCHKAASKSTLDHATSVPSIDDTMTTSCGATGINCHNTKDIHALHKDSTSANGGCDLTGCHDFGKQAFYATKRSCGAGGACHTNYNLNNYFITHTNSAEVAAHAPTAGNVVQSGNTSYQGIACDSCHIVTAAQGGLVSAEHTATYSQQTISTTNSCINCHNNTNSSTAISNDWSAKDTAGACAACHTGTMAIHTDANSTAHTTVTGANCASTGIGCHNTADLSSVGATATAANTVIHNSCLRCHSRTGAAAWSNTMIGTGGNVKFNPNVESCGQATGCHTSTYYTATAHRATTNNINGNDTVAHGATGMTSVLTSGSASSACDACHSTTLLPAHNPAKTTALLGSGHTAWSSTAASTCQDCHNANVAPTAGAATQVKGHWTNNTCADCHTTYHDTLNSHTGTGVGCVGTGNGCHATADLRALHSGRVDGCVLAGCHDAVDKAMNSAPKDCLNVACHNGYTGTSHGLVDGNDSTHQALSMNTNVDGTTYNAGGGNSCQSCHSSLASAHAEAGPTSALGSGNTAWTAGQSVCLDCHNNAIAPVANAATVVNSDWNTGAKLCSNCHATLHNTYTLAKHTTTTGSGCVLGGCHGGVTDVRELHNRGATGGCTAYGVDGKLDANTDQDSACHQLDKQMTPITSKPMSCGSGSTAGSTQCHINHTTSNHAISNGAVDCTGCHFNAAGTMTNMQPMVDDTGTYHHVLDYYGGPGYAPGAGGDYPTDKRNLTCTSCHVDHDKFNATLGRARNLRTTINGVSATATNTDFINGGDYGICVSCHSITQTRKVSGVATGQASNGSTTTPVIDGSRYAASAHNYSIPTSSGSGGAKDQFNANCSKCHDDENDAKSTMDTTRTIATHFSTSSGLARALGATLPAGSHTVEENLCYRCHGTDASPTVAGKDGYGVQAMTARARDIKRSYNSLYKHAVASSTATGRHKADEYDRAPQTISPTMSVPGWYGPMAGGQQALRHSECEDCHNPHVARSENTTEFPDRFNPRGSTAVTISPANEGVWGVNIIGPNNVATNGDWAGSKSGVASGAADIPVYTKIAESQYEWQFCLKCHSRYAWGNTATPTVPSGTVTGSQGFMTDVGRDFDPDNYAFHPLFQTGRNQPPVTANGNWTKTTSTILRWNPQTNAFVTGLSNTFVDGWFSTSRVTCSDCHGNEKWGGGLARGVHGASRKWLVRAVNTGIVTTRGNNGSAPALTNAGFSEKAQCTNCHRGDVYGDSDSDDPATTYSVLGRGNHGSGWTSCDSETKVPKQINGCNNCHAGRNAPTDGATTAPLNGMNHGTSCVQGADNGGDPNFLGERFCNGASWDSHQFGKQSRAIGCSTVNAASNYSQCDQHTTWNEKTATAVYAY